MGREEEEPRLLHSHVCLDTNSYQLRFTTKLINFVEFQVQIDVNTLVYNNILTDLLFAHSQVLHYKKAWPPSNIVKLHSYLILNCKPFEISVQSANMKTCMIIVVAILTVSLLATHSESCSGLYLRVSHCVLILCFFSSQIFKRGMC